jgi:hypothetical protein
MDFILERFGRAWQSLREEGEMLDPWVIEEIRRREQEREERSRPELRIEIEPPLPMEQPQEEKTERGVVVIDL